MCLYLRHCKDIIFFDAFQIFSKVSLNKVLFLTDFISEKKGRITATLRKKPKTINQYYLK